MAHTQEQWFHKIASFLPAWYLDKAPAAVRADTSTPEMQALLMGLAKVAVTLETEIYAQFAQTYIDHAVAEVLDLHASERRVERLTGESDVSLRPRIKAFGETYNSMSLENALAIILDSTYTEYALVELEADGPWMGTDDIFLPYWGTGLTKIYNRGLVEIFPKKVVIDADTTIAVGDELQAPWLIVAEGVTLTVEGTLSATFVRGPGTVVNSGGTVQTYADYDAYVTANKTDIYASIVEFISNNKALGVFVAVQSYLESGL